ncbi:thiamine diphosphokinase [Marispirochaeta aestuarii]|uniref:Thiamine diphosphokinase n=1 Tax=Marispirochaeta aestuarii TaxID=1963862 RepID=A0A1Y1RVB6_9SPIO|nr:thiamine diphosphokinase [Marispirochaeta aestuarii]ORC31883.1 thiamine diphosphokinase [Marispirochaeta aestuarii]
MDGCLLIGGKAPDKNLLGPRMNDWDIIIAADSGLHHARSLGLTPTELIGDFDSVEQQCIDDYPDMIIHRHKPDKDETDTELGIELLRRRGARRIHIVGGGGGRLDHLYALLSLFHRENPPDYWYTHREHIQLIQGEMLIYPGINRRVSFFPLGTGECRMKTSGLKWPLDSLRWKVGDFGISNIVTNEEVKIEMKKGKLIMVYDLGNEDSL